MNGTEIAKPGTESEPLVYRLPVAGQILGGISRGTVANLIRKGELQVVPIGATRMVTRESIVAYIARQKKKAESGNVRYYGSRNDADAAAA